ncbi:uncharacterized protein LTR77_008047 [Saxophila tyrrhenica]|uniref:Uncharacterized protein n=1 Tax=Saxophila tyrrhenica TaxID=1690608 RepID=A0AAV9P295_9PEZI|nr:hypothetical protein LTR77_008047 [Saxophila tyrrhenica]
MWVRHIPLSIGNDACLDSATTYYIESMMSFLSPSDASQQRACVAGSKALRCLREAVTYHTKDDDPSQLLLTIALHRYAEIVEAMIQGRDSLFDTQGPYLASPSMNGIKDALLALQDLYVRIARLVRLVRAAGQCEARPHDTTLEAFTLAESLHASSAETCILQALAEEVTSLRPRTAHNTLLPLCLDGEAHDFRSLEGYILATQYWAYRILLCGLLDHLLSNHWPPPANLSNVTLEGIRSLQMDAAINVAKSVPYALGLSHAHPVRAVRLRLALQVAYGVWCRLERRQRSQTAPDYDLAVEMKQWTLETLARIDALWGFEEDIQHDSLERACEAAAGGMLWQDDLMRWRDCR